MNMDRYFFQTDQLQLLLDNLKTEGYRCIGPQVRDEAVVYGEISRVEQLPVGINDAQAPGSYTLTSSNSTKFFYWANGPQAIKPALFTATEMLWQCEAGSDGKLTFKTAELNVKPLAFFGVRACDIAALKLQDQHFLQQQFIDPYYQARRANSFIVAVNCSRPASTCFCHSTGDGPFADDGFDLALTELDEGFLCTPQTDKGRNSLSGLMLHTPTPQQLAQEQKIFEHAIRQQRQLPNLDIQRRLFEELDNKAWDEIAERCLSCGNCTAVCPTCFCHNEVEVAALDGASSSHYREWDSCFTQGHSYIHGITIRADTSQRYRQWLTHKFSSWYDQYGRSGCVGCGRCITWCPVGIDVIASITDVCGAGS